MVLKSRFFYGIVCNWNNCCTTLTRMHELLRLSFRLNNWTLAVCSNTAPCVPAHEVIVFAHDLEHVDLVVD